MRNFKYCYSFGSSLYIPLTSRCNSLTLPETRGPRFTLPAVVVSSLCQVRDAEAQSAGLDPKWTQWCNWLDTQDEQFKCTLPKRINGSRGLQITDLDETLRLPSVHNLLNEVVSSDLTMWKSLVIGGEGEPTLRLTALIELVQGLHQARIKSEKGCDTVTIRVTTNGLLIPEKRNNLLEAVASDSGKPIIDSFSIALMTHSSDQYDELMQPEISEIAQQTKPYFLMQDFILAVLKAGIAVEATAVDRPDVDKEATQHAAAALGIYSPVRWRPYFP